jgi:hypothetical protein
MTFDNSPAEGAENGSVDESVDLILQQVAGDIGTATFDPLNWTDPQNENLIAALASSVTQVVTRILVELCSCVQTNAFSALGALKKLKFKNISKFSRHNFIA